MLSDGYSPQSLFTESTFGLIRDDIASAGLFYIGADFNVWKDLCDPGVDSFVAAFCNQYGEFLSKRRRSSDEHYADCKRVNRLSRAEQGSRNSSVVRSSSNSSVGKEKSDSIKAGEKGTVLNLKRVEKPKKSDAQADGSKTTTPKKKLQKNVDHPVFDHST